MSASTDLPNNTHKLGSLHYLCRCQFSDMGSVNFPYMMDQKLEKYFILLREECFSVHAI